MGALGSSAVSLVNPLLASSADKIARALFSGGSSGWGTLIGKEIDAGSGVIDYAKPKEIISSAEIQEAILSSVKWSGDKNGHLYFLVGLDCAKTIVAYMTALLMGGNPNPGDVKLDSEGMDAYQEAVNSFFGQAAQQARAELAENIKLSVESCKIVNFSSSSADDIFASIAKDDVLCYKTILNIDGGPAPFPVELFMTSSVTGVNIDEDHDKQALEAVASTLGLDYKNLQNILDIKLPLVVIIAQKLMRMELIQEMCPGTIIEFKKMSDEMLDVMIGNVKIAEAEAVITNQHFGIQLRKVVDYYNVQD